ncbi:MAG: cyclase family protein [Chloroflexota bacterium]
MTDALLKQFVESATVYDLDHALESTMPVSPNHPGFKMALLRRHGDMLRPDGGSASNEMIMLGGHTGTHLDALCHVSHNGTLFGGLSAADAQRGGRFSALGVDSVQPLFCRGVMLDVAGYRGVARLPAGEPISAAELQAVARAQRIDALPRGGAVLVRSGWAAHWDQPETYLGHRSGVPGPDVSAAEWIASAGVRVTGHDSMAYERLAPGAGHSALPVHRILLVDSGIHIIENVDMEVLAEKRAYEFLFVCLPLKIVGATGSPVRPIAVVV